MNLEDIAKLAGVSKSAVSFALNGKPGISEETRDRVLKIAKTHNYKTRTKKQITKSINKSLTFLVFANSGIVLKQYSQQPFFRELIQYIEEQCRTLGYSLLFSTIDTDNLEQEIAKFGNGTKSDGVIILGTDLSPSQINEIVRQIGPNLIVLDTNFDMFPVHFISINNYMGGYQAGSYLYDLGHRNFGYVASNVRIHNFDERKLGFMAALNERGTELQDDCMFIAEPAVLSVQEECLAQFEKYLASGRKLPSAIFCECDYIAISMVKTLNQLNIRVPEDVSLVGFDNIQESIAVTPELTTIHVEKEIIAQQAVNLLVESIEKNVQIKSKIKIDTRLVIRESTEPLAPDKH